MIALIKKKELQLLRYALLTRQDSGYRDLYRKILKAHGYTEETHEINISNGYILQKLR